MEAATCCAQRVGERLGPGIAAASSSAAAISSIAAATGWTEGMRVGKQRCGSWQATGLTGWGAAAIGIPAVSAEDAAGASGEFSLTGGPHKRAGWLPGGAATLSGSRLVRLERVSAGPPIKQKRISEKTK
jgi:hypothetical protein